MSNLAKHMPLGGKNKKKKETYAFVRTFFSSIQWWICRRTNVWIWWHEPHIRTCEFAVLKSLLDL
jgi:hypothetical protein